MGIAGVFRKVRSLVAGASAFTLIIVVFQIAYLVFVYVLLSGSKSDAITANPLLWRNVIFACGISMAIWQFVSSKRWKCWVGVVLEAQIIFLMEQVYPAPFPLCFEIIFVLNLYTFSLYERPVIVGLFSAVLVSEWIVFGGVSPESWILALLAVISVVTGSRMVLFQEHFINAGLENKRLGETLTRMDRANREYQEQLLRLEARSTASERNRITRDIHDIVGYALTNNMMLIEMATSVMNTDALKAYSILHRAKENARDGMYQVRDTLYALRAVPAHFPHGVEAISQTTRFFERATGIRIRLNTSGSWAENRELDKAVLYLIKEGLLNSFRHGKATEVTIHVDVTNNGLDIIIRDDGVKTDDFKEGIGLKGARERLEKLGGRLEAGNAVDGFLLKAEIPVAEIHREIDEEDVEDDSSTDS